MSRSALLSAYEKMAGLLGKLPGSLQEPILRELDPIKEVFLRQRPPRLAVLGDEGIELPALVNALAGRAALHAPLLRGPWTTVRGVGTIELADLRSSGVLAEEPADTFLFVTTGSSNLPAEAVRAVEVLTAASPREGGSPAGLVVLVLGEAGESAAVLAALAGAGAASSVVFSAHLPRTGLENGFPAAERSALGDRLCDYLPEDAQLEMARFLAARGAQARLAGTVLKAFGAVAGVVGMQPIPLADFPVLLSLQLFMVSLIIYVSGREFSLRLAGEFATSLGIGFGAGLVFRETARAAVKILPVWGSMISGGVAGAGTYALGRAAIAYYIEEIRVPRLSLRRRGRVRPPSLEG
ncbi:MAG: YcjF family protein [Chthoniobacterales bacterium]